MPRPKAPPTPAASTDLTAREKVDLTSSFILPPAAMDGSEQTSVSPPESPEYLPGRPSPPRKRTLSGSHKIRETLPAQQYDLPPPPSRARKIIQMKPKTGSTSSVSASESPLVPTLPVPKSSSPTASKRKQPSSTSAAGRKIARKTAHSIIERRRRSKMNEEFGVLKDMIPACEGVEMHKLAILQAGIEYVRYLEGCIKQMKVEKEQETKDDVSDGSMDEDETSSPEPEPVGLKEPEQHFSQGRTTSSLDWQYRKPSIATTSSSSNPSPNIMPKTHHRFSQPSHRPILPNLSSLATASPQPTPYSSTPTPTLLSPAFGAIQFSPDLARTGTNSTHSSISMITASPNILPLPQAMMSLERNIKNGSPAVSEGGAEATATAALMMMSSNGTRLGSMVGAARVRGKGMSVRDLLTS